MTTASNLWGGGWGSSRLHMRAQALSRRRARRMCRRFAGVGVGIAPARLQEIVAGAPAAEEELTDVNFALAATEIQREERLARSAHRHRRSMWWLIVGGLILVSLNVLICMAYLIFVLAQQSSPY